MEPVIYLSFIILVLLLTAGFWLLYHFQQKKWQVYEANISNNNQAIDVLTKWLHEMRNSIDRNTSTVYQQFEATHQVINNRLDSATRVIHQVSRELGQIQEIGRQIQQFQDVIQSPKLRGNIGEQILNDLLEQMLPRNYFHLQYRFNRGVIVDAIIQTEKGMIPIDAKFPIEAYRRFNRSKKAVERKKYALEFARQVKKHIDQVSTKYIIPDEGTVDFALIYIPSEVIYYEILQQGDQIAGYANQKSILLVSPNSFYYFLKIILVALESKRIESAGRQILTMLSGLKQDSQHLTDQLRILTGHLTNAKNSLDRVNHESQQLQNKIDSTQHLDFDADAEGGN